MKLAIWEYDDGRYRRALRKTSSKYDPLAAAHAVADAHAAGLEAVELWRGDPENRSSKTDENLRLDHELLIGILSHDIADWLRQDGQIVTGPYALPCVRPLVTVRGFTAHGDSAEEYYWTYSDGYIKSMGREGISVRLFKVRISQAPSEESTHAQTEVRFK